MGRSFTREEFYDLVWSKPMTRLAKEFGLSDVALHKICAKHGIPKPPVGYWNKLAAGKPVVRSPLPRSAEAARISITAGTLHGEPDSVGDAREAARLALTSFDCEADATSHPIVKETIKELRQAKPVRQSPTVKAGRKGCIKAEVAQSSVPRLELALNRIAAAAELLGIDLVATDAGAAFRCDGEDIAFGVAEHVRREKHVPTEKELAAQEAWRKRRDRGNLNHGWDFDRDPFPHTNDWDYHASGQLMLELPCQYFQDASPRRSFRDAKIQRLETMGPEIAVGIAVYAAAQKAERIRCDVLACARAEEARVRELAMRAQHISQRRAMAIAEILEEVDQIDRLRRLIGSLRGEIGGADHPRVRECLGFAEKDLSEREASIGVAGLADRFERLRLFGDDDDYDFGVQRRW